ncbi:Double-stranded RNA-binding protein 2 [Gossypium arboreum]|uniref:Double-stranded RNA-binding protein 2 n=1 Tax=Gossypium arboreum TaxID=29729 RepID=A0A0B0P8P5_GOSAR|nr:Double-stranded RNA-binding protein 2 [Gossypium arboreum]
MKNFNYCSTLRGPSHSLAAGILDETGVYKNLLQEIAQRVGAPLPQYTTFRSGLGHLPIFTGTVELAGIRFTGEPAKNKKQAEKNAAMAAWTSLKLLAKETASSSSEPENNDELEQITIARALLNFRIKEKMAMANSSNAPILFTKKFPSQNPRPTSPQPPATTSKILPLICPKVVPRNRSMSATVNEKPVLTSQTPTPESRGVRPQKFPAAGAAPYVPIRQLRTPCCGIAPPVTIRTAVPVFSAPPRPAPAAVSPQPPTSAVPTHPAQPAQSVLPPNQLPATLPSQVLRAPPVRIAQAVTIRQVVPVFAAPPVRKEDKQSVPLRNEDITTATAAPPPNQSPFQAEEAASTISKNLQESETVIAVNGAFPGPVVNVTTVNINVHNQLDENPPMTCQVLHHRQVAIFDSSEQWGFPQLVPIRQYLFPLPGDQFMEDGVPINVLHLQHLALLCLRHQLNQVMKNFNYCSTLRGPSHSLAAGILPWGVIGVSLLRRRDRRRFSSASRRELLECPSIVNDLAEGSVINGLIMGILVIKMFHFRPSQLTARG